jgi:hypothetical protein
MIKKSKTTDFGVWVLRHDYEEFKTWAFEFNADAPRIVSSKSGKTADDLVVKIGVEIVGETRHFHLITRTYWADNIKGMPSMEDAITAGEKWLNANFRADI